MFLTVLHPETRNIMPNALLDLAVAAKDFQALRVIHNVCLGIEAGEIVSLVGPAVAARAPCCASLPVWALTTGRGAHQGRSAASAFP
jgi:ABC-type branched-subunit amino acid transport system ATPase component